MSSRAHHLSQEWMGHMHLAIGSTGTERFKIQSSGPRRVVGTRCTANRPYLSQGVDTPGLNHCTGQVAQHVAIRMILSRKPVQSIADAQQAVIWMNGSQRLMQIAPSQLVRAGHKW